MWRCASPLVLLVAASTTFAQPDAAILLKPERVFDGTTGPPHAGWVVLVTGGKIAAVGPADQVEAPKEARAMLNLD